jgi:hypothetical protein
MSSAAALYWELDVPEGLYRPSKKKKKTLIFIHHIIIIKKIVPWAVARGGCDVTDGWKSGYMGILGV